jgi:hypothetical protein
MKCSRILPLVLGNLVAAAGFSAVAHAGQGEAPQPRPITIRWTPVKTVNALEQAFTVERKTGRDGEPAKTVQTIVLTGKDTQFVLAGRDGEPAPPPGTFKDIVVGARVQITGILNPDGRVEAKRVHVSPPRPGKEG